MRLYETIIITDPEQTDENRDALLEKIKGYITTQGGEIVEEDRWGMKRMAYEIKKQRMGYYTLFQFKGTPAITDEMERNFRITDEVFRYILLRLDS